MPLHPSDNPAADSRSLSVGKSKGRSKIVCVKAKTTFMASVSELGLGQLHILQTVWTQREAKALALR